MDTIESETVKITTTIVRHDDSCCECNSECAHNNTGTKMINGDMTTFCYDCKTTL
jgi:hypothetical protein